jgi:hypothetical protein
MAMMQAELGQEDADELSHEHIARLGGLIEAFMQGTGLRFGYTLLTLDRNGIKTSGNMPPDAQAELFTVVALRMHSEGPDAVAMVKTIDPPAH